MTMNRAIVRELRLFAGGLDPSTHRFMRSGGEVGATEVTVKIVHVDGDKRDPKLHIEGRRVGFRKDGTLGAFPGDFYFFDDARPDWLQTLVDEAVAEFASMTRETVHG
jgi:hypothetical protein